VDRENLRLLIGLNCAEDIDWQLMRVSLGVFSDENMHDGIWSI